MSTAKFQKGEEEDRLRRIRITLSSRNVKALEKGMSFNILKCPPYFLLL
jgi:hypothetical protein